MTHVVRHWNQLMKELDEWQRFGKDIVALNGQI